MADVFISYNRSAVSYTHLFAVIGALWYGAIDIINHYVLRFILLLSGRTPLRLIRYLDSAVKIRLLRRIGGGYAFIHRALLEHFAAREPAAKS